MVDISSVEGFGKIVLMLVVAFIIIIILTYFVIKSGLKDYEKFKENIRHNEDEEDLY